ncbi:MAG: histidine kinase N-terminal 7TM domain-containing protein [Bacillota bacterium]|nr:histidine kinase N-terminal 7TM domain-containing protein [Bacillota bacterium]
MGWLIGVALLFFSMILSIGLSIYFLFYGKKSFLLYSFIFCQALIFIWSSGYIVEILSTTLQLKWVAVIFEGVAICFIGFAWLVFSMVYTKNRFRKNRVVLCGMLIIPIIEYILLITNFKHGLYYKEFNIYGRQYGIAFWINIISTYIYVFIGTIMIIKYTITMLGNQKKQSILLIIAVTVPIISNIMYLTKILMIKIDVTPLSFSLSLLLFAALTFRYRFLNSIPAGLRKVFDTVEASIILIDNTNSIVLKNNSFINTFAEYKGCNVNDFCNYLSKRMIGDYNNTNLMNSILKCYEKPIFGEMHLNIDNGKIFRVSVQSVKDSINIEIGRVVSFTDITLYRNLSNELSEKNIQLTEANDKLRQHMAVVEELAVLKERNRVAREIHDSIGHTLTFLVKIHEGAIMDFGKNNDRMLESIKTANKVTRQGLKELRLSLYDMMTERQDTGMLFQELERLSADFKNSDIKIVITNECSNIHVKPELSKSILRICQEAVTNSIKHGNADEINIIIRLDGKILKMYIIDNGKGCSEIRKGYGLSGMEERVKKYGGIIQCGSDGESGFNIRIEIPIITGVDNLND